MTRFLFKVIICALLATAASATYLSVISGDPAYTLQEWISPARFAQHDALIRSVATELQLDPMLVKAVVWRESRFDSHKFGSAGERGLMQVTEKAAQEWARENHVENFRAEELFDPKINVKAGSWYLRRAMQHWETQSDPIPVCPGGIQCRGEPCSALGRRERCGYSSKDVPSQYRFPGDTEIRRYDHGAA